MTELCEDELYSCSRCQFPVSERTRVVTTMGVVIVDGKVTRLIRHSKHPECAKHSAFLGVEVGQPFPKRK